MSTQNSKKAKGDSFNEYRSVLRNSQIHINDHHFHSVSLNLSVHLLWKGRKTSLKREKFPVYLLLPIIKNNIMLRIVRIMARVTINAASGPPPIIMGNGPIIITPPKLIDPPEKTTANIKTVIPTSVSKKPRKNKTNTYRRLEFFSSATIWLSP
jgi:hypothetical protein